MNDKYCNQIKDNNEVEETSRLTKIIEGPIIPCLMAIGGGVWGYYAGREVGGPAAVGIWSITIFSILGYIGHVRGYG